MPRPALPAQPTPSLAATTLRPKLVKTKPASTARMELLGQMPTPGRRGMFPDTLES